MTVETRMIEVPANGGVWTRTTAFLAAHLQA